MPGSTCAGIGTVALVVIQRKVADLGQQQTIVLVQSLVVPLPLPLPRSLSLAGRSSAWHELAGINYSYDALPAANCSTMTSSLRATCLSGQRLLLLLLRQQLPLAYIKKKQ